MFTCVVSIDSLGHRRYLRRYRPFKRHFNGQRLLFSMGFPNLRSLSCFPIALSTGELGQTNVVDTVQNELYETRFVRLQKRRIVSSNFNEFTLNMKFTSNYQVDPKSAIWISYCDESDKCGTIQTDKEKLASGSTFLNVTDYDSISGGITFNISTSDFIGENEQFNVFVTEFKICTPDDEHCYGQRQCDQDWDYTSVNETCGWSEKYCANGQDHVTVDLNFADYGVSTIEDTTVNAIAGKRYEHANNIYMYSYFLYVEYSENTPSDPEIASFVSKYVTVTYSNDQVMVSETLSRLDLATNGLILHGKAISDVQVKLPLAPGTDSVTITKFEVCESSTNICQGIDTCAPSGDVNSFDYCPVVTTVAYI